MSLPTGPRAFDLGDDADRLRRPRLRGLPSVKASETLTRLLEPTSTSLVIGSLRLAAHSRLGPRARQVLDDWTLPVTVASLRLPFTHP